MLAQIPKIYRFLILGLVLFIFIVLSSQIKFFSEEITVTLDDGSAPTSCAPKEVARIALDFIEAINKNDHEQVRSMLDSNYFQWYSVGNEFSSRFRPLEALYTYLDERHQYNEVYKLRQISLNSYEGGTIDLGHITFVLDVQAEDFEVKFGYPYLTVVGKGSVKCTNGARSIAVWSVASPEDVLEENILIPQLCPLPVGSLKENAILACTAQN